MCRDTPTDAFAAKQKPRDRHFNDLCYFARYLAIRALQGGPTEIRCFHFDEIVTVTRTLDLQCCLDTAAERHIAEVQ